MFTIVKKIIKKHHIPNITLFGTMFHEIWDHVSQEFSQKIGDMRSCFVRIIKKFLFFIAYLQMWNKKLKANFISKKIKT